jgi:ribosomal protein S1
MADLLALEEHKVRSFNVGQRVKGKVIAKTPASLILDIGGKSEGLITEKAFVESREYIKGLKIGDEVTATVIVSETREGAVLLSLRQTSYDATWEKMLDARNKEEPIVVLWKAQNPSGVTVQVENLMGFIPNSQLGKEVLKRPEDLIGKYFKAKVIEVDKSSNKIVLSEKAVSDAEDIKTAKEALAKIKEGEVYEGEVTTVANFGCFVRIKLPGDNKKELVNIEGLVYISELSWNKVTDPSGIVKTGDTVSVKVLGVKDGKLSLSIKQAKKDPWDDLDKRYKLESKLKGKVTRISDFGVFVLVEPAVEGLIHITKIPPGKKLSVGDEVNCYVEEIDKKSKKLSLGLVLTTKPLGYK